MPDGLENLPDADAIAKRINPADFCLAATTAAREVILRTRQYLRARQSFAIESAFSSRRILDTMRAARERGIQAHPIYICVINPEWSIERVRQRAAQGGHDVPDEDVRRRYRRSLLNLPEAPRVAHKAWLFDNTGDEPRKVLETRDASVVWHSNDEPAWVPSWET